MPNAPRPPAPPATDPFDLCGVTIADKYRVDSLVGTGGFGVVYRGEHLGFEEPIAIKCLKLPGELDESDRSKFLARLQDEGRVLHRLSKQTTGIVQALDVGAVTTPTGSWVPYLVLEWLEGQTLAAMLSERRAAGRGRMSLEESIAFLEPAAEALAVAHRQKVAHRDVKPENIFVLQVDGHQVVKVLDFGIAKVLTHHASFASMATQKGATAFTPSYGAPEQFNKKRGATGPWTDVFALALLVVELMTGQRALDGDDATQLYIASADPAARPTPRHHGVTISDAAEEVLATALAVDPPDRYPDVGAFWDALRVAAGQTPPAEPAASDVSDTGEFVNRSGIELDAVDATRSMLATEVMLVEPPGSDLEHATSARRPLAERGAHPRTAPKDPAQREQFAARSTTREDGDDGRTRSKGAQRAEKEARGTTNSEAGAPARSRGLPFLPFTVGLALAGAGALAWQLNSIGPSPHAIGDSSANRRSSPTAWRVPTSRPQPTTTAASSVTPPTPSALVIEPAGDGGAGGAAGPTGGAGGASSREPDPPPPGMVRVVPGGDAPQFFIDKTEVTTRDYTECVMAGRCKKATRVVLTEESARAFGVTDTTSALAPDKLAAAWEKRCNQARRSDDHPINCVNWASADDYCGWRKKRLPTAAEWTAAAIGGSPRRHPWGDDAPECNVACFGLNGTCVSGTSQVTTCAVAGHPKDATSAGIVDLAGNVAEWVADEARESSADGPRFRVLKGGSFLDEASSLDLAASRGAPPVTAYVAIGFRCAANPTSEP